MKSKDRYSLEGKLWKNLDSILKRKYITLPTKVWTVKSMVFTEVMCKCESWTTKKAEHWRIDAFELWCWRWLKSPLDCKEVRPVSPKKNQSWIFAGRTDAEAEAPLLWLSDAKTWLTRKKKMLGKTEGTKRREQQRMRWLNSITGSIDMSLSKF